MPILNYTTSINANKTVAEIQGILAKAKAQAIMTEYDGDGTLKAINFRIKTQFGLMTFCLPGNAQKVYQVLVRQRVAPKMRTKEQAARVAWRITKDWLEAQLAMVQAEMVDLEQVFLPYIQDPNTGFSHYETLKERRFDTLALPTSLP